MSVQDQLDRISTELQTLRASVNSSSGRTRKQGETKLKSLLAEVCDAVRQATAYPNVDGASMEKADDLIHEMVDIGYGEKLGIDYMPPFTGQDGDSLVNDTEREKLAGALGNVFSPRIYVSVS